MLSCASTKVSPPILMLLGPLVVLMLLVLMGVCLVVGTVQTKPAVMTMMMTTHAASSPRLHLVATMRIHLPDNCGGSDGETKKKKKKTTTSTMTVKGSFHGDR